MDLPRDAKVRVASGVAAYVRAISKNELPASLKGVGPLVTTAKGERAQATKLVAALDDEALRKRILEWLDEDRPQLKKDVQEALRLACARPEGWSDRLAEKEPPSRTEPAARAAVTAVEKRLEAERQAAKRAREEAKRVRDEARTQVEHAERSASDMKVALEAERRKVRDLERKLTEAGAEAKRTAKALARLDRKIEQMRDAHAQEKTKLETRIKALNKEKRELEQRAHRVEAKRRKPSKPAQDERPGGRRERLKPPGGLTDDSVAALEAWLKDGALDVVVDGYNVTRHRDGFPDLSLEEQRTRLIGGLMGLVPRFKARWLLVWDGGEVPPGRQRKKPHPKLGVEFSPPAADETDKDRADRLIVERVRALPPHPVIVVTNDRGLRDQLAPLHVTYARAEQLLALLR